MSDDTEEEEVSDEDSSEESPEQETPNEKIHRKYELAIEHVKAQLTRLDTNNQETKASIIKELSAPENAGLFITDISRRYLDSSEAYELTLLQLNKFLEDYAGSLEESVDLRTFKKKTEEIMKKLELSLRHERKRSTDFYEQVMHLTGRLYAYEGEEINEDIIRKYPDLRVIQEQRKAYNEWLEEQASRWKKRPSEAPKRVKEYIPELTQPVSVEQTSPEDATKVIEEIKVWRKRGRPRKIEVIEQPN